MLNSVKTISLNGAVMFKKVFYCVFLIGMTSCNTKDSTLSSTDPSAESFTVKLAIQEGFKDSFITDSGELWIPLGGLLVSEKFKQIPTCADYKLESIEQSDRDVLFTAYEDRLKSNETDLVYMRALLKVPRPLCRVKPKTIK
jgi:hypothetical protein